MQTIARKLRQKQKASLEKMFEMLGPYLPKTNLEEPDPGRKWTLSNSDECSHTEPKHVEES